MHGTTLTRLARLTTALIRRPQDISRYLFHGPWSGRSTLSLQLPWFSYAAIDAIEKIIRPTDRVCELGGGGSTLWFASRVAQIVTIESDRGWAMRLRESVPSTLRDRVEIRESPLPPPFTPFDPAVYLAPLVGMTFDWVILDFLDDQFDRRALVVPWLERNLLAQGGVLVLDDAWRYPQIAALTQAERRLEFYSVGPARLGVTGTDLYFYAPRNEAQ